MTRRSRITLLLAIAFVAVIALAVYWVTRGPSAERLLGAPLPPSAKVIDIADRSGMFGGDYFAVIEMSESDFRALVQRMGLFHRPDLLEYWLFALRAPTDIQSWKVTEINDENTFFGDQRESTYLVARYEGGKMYFKVHVY
jgi:hypothetical protein